MKKAVASVLFAVFGSIPSALALEGPKFTFEATYDVTGTGGHYTMRQASDGNEHMLNETTMADGSKSISIYDYPNKQITVFRPGTKEAMRSPMNDVGASFSFDADSMKKSGFTSLGTKEFDGHPCHGWETSAGGTKDQQWIGDDTKYLVHSVTITGPYQITMALKQWSTQSPAASEFQIPPQYKITTP